MREIEKYIYGAKTAADMVHKILLGIIKES